MAAPIAYEEPTISRAWQAVVDHLPTMLLVWVATVVLAVLGVAVSLLVFLVVVLASGGGMSSMDEVTFLASGMGNLAQVPFLLLSSMVGVLMMAVPAIHYETGETIGVERAFRHLFRRPLRYLLAGLIFGLTCALGIVLCIVPGIIVVLTVPVYVNRIFNGDEPIMDALLGSFQAVYGSERGRTFLGIQLLAVLAVTLVSVCTCLLGALVAIPVATFYIQNSAYRQGVLR